MGRSKRSFSKNVKTFVDTLQTQRLYSMFAHKEDYKVRTATGKPSCKLENLVNYMVKQKGTVNLDGELRSGGGGRESIATPTPCNTAKLFSHPLHYKLHYKGSPIAEGATFVEVCGQAHDALADARGAAFVYIALLKRWRRKGTLLGTKVSDWMKADLAGNAKPLHLPLPEGWIAPEDLTDSNKAEMKAQAMRDWKYRGSGPKDDFLVSYCAKRCLALRSLITCLHLVPALRSVSSSSSLPFPPTRPSG